VGLGIDAVIASAKKGKIPVIAVLPDYVKRGGAVRGGGRIFLSGRGGRWERMADSHVRGPEDVAKMPINYSLPKTYGVKSGRSRRGLAGPGGRLPADLLAKSTVVGGWDGALHKEVGKRFHRRDA